jgi:MutS domain V
VTTVPVPYAQNASRHAADGEREAQRSTLIARLRLTTFLVAAAVLVWTLSRGATPLPLVVAFLLFVAFGILVAWHARVDERVAWHDALRAVNMRALARRARDWHGLPDADAPAGVDLTDHPYALDLDLFGRASLFQWLGPAATIRGRVTLATWLLQPAPRAEVISRQAAVAELATLDDWRLKLEAHGLLTAGARQQEIDRFLAWAEGPDAFGRNAALLRGMVLTIVGTMWVLIAAHATGLTSVALWPIPLVAGLVLSFATADRLQKTFDRAGGGQDALGRYGAIFEHAVVAPRGSAQLSGLLERLSAEGHPAPDCMRRLNRILGFGELRRGAAILHFPVQALTLWDFHVLFALERWRHMTGRRVRGWLEALGELDALAQLGTARRDNPEWAVPGIGPVPDLTAEAIGHPLIAADRRVANDVTIGPRGTVLLITGSNMSGKSTLLRSVGLNIVLAQAGAVVCARQMSLPECDLQTSIRVQDSLERGLSYFMAALARLKGVVDAAQHEREGRMLVYLLDEILQGTNSVERSIAVRAVTRHLIDAGAIGAMTTHDLSLAEEEPMKSAAQFMHFSETLDADGTMRFDYTLKPGLATSRNALRLMQMIGIEL